MGREPTNKVCQVKNKQQNKVNRVKPKIKLVKILNKSSNSQVKNSKLKLMKIKI